MRVRTIIKSFFVKALIAFFLLLLSSSLSFASSHEDVNSILDALLGDTYPVSYKAEEVVIFFSESEAPRVRNYRTGVLKPDKIRRESYSISGSAEDVVVHDTEMKIVYYPSEKIVVRGPREKIRTKQIVAEMAMLVKANYDIHVEGESKVSGRKVFVVSITPKKRGTRPSFRVWMDQDYLLVLKTETHGIEGKISYQNTYKKLTINPSFNQGYFVIMVPPGTAAYEIESTSGGNVDVNDMLELQNVSGGYVLKETVKNGDGHFQLIYHDGLNSISVFSEDLTESESVSTEKIFSQSGAMVEKVNIKGLDAIFCKRGSESLMRFVSDGHKYTVVGEASKEGLVEISLDIKKRAGKR